jgi:hypothetical protein
MVLQMNLTADGRRTRGTGRADLWCGRFDPSPPNRSDHRLASLAGSAKLRKATTVNAGEGS